MTQLVSKMPKLVPKMTAIVTLQTIFVHASIDWLAARPSPYSSIANTGPTKIITIRPSPPIRCKCHKPAPASRTLETALPSREPARNVLEAG